MTTTPTIPAWLQDKPNPNGAKTPPTFPGDLPDTEPSPIQKAETVIEEVKKSTRTRKHTPPKLEAKPTDMLAEFAALTLSDKIAMYTQMGDNLKEHADNARKEAEGILNLVAGLTK
jgi:hypothetical protein